MTNVPSGLTANVVRTSDTVVTFTLDGMADVHAIVGGVNIQCLSAAFNPAVSDPR